MLQEFIDIAPFQEATLATPAQQGAWQPAGLLANGQAASELMGHWNPGVMSGLTPSGDVPSFLGWFNFPGIPGTQGDPTAALGGGDGFSCSAGAPPECVELLEHISSVDVQTRFAETGAGLPVTRGAESGVSAEPAARARRPQQRELRAALARHRLRHHAVGGAMNDAIVNLFARHRNPQDIVDAMNAAAATL